MFPGPLIVSKESASMVLHLLRKRPAPVPLGAVQAYQLPVAGVSSLGWIFVYSSLLSLLGWGLLLRMLLLPR